MSAPRAPETDAGRALLNWSDGATDYHAAVCLALQGESCSCELPDAILAIEAELRASLAAKVRALPGLSIGEGTYPEYVRREWVLALIEGSDPASPEAFDRLVAEGEARVLNDLAARYSDVLTAIEMADTRTGALEWQDGTVEVYSLRAADWNRIVAVARGHMSEKARRSLNRFRERTFREAAR